MACTECNVPGIVLGSIFGTLAFVAIVLGIAYLIWRKRRKSKNNTQQAEENGNKTKNAYDNPNYQGDVEMGAASDAEMFKQKGFGGYVECIEYERPQKNTSDINANGREKIVQKNSFASFGGILQQQQKSSGSRGSLDNSYNSFLGPEVIEVALESQDVIGLGFNVCGSLSEGIFVDQIHNRGPAVESGKIKVGDRILSISISFENIVFEDALTILSYASPYPVRLQLHRADSRPRERLVGEAPKEEITHSSSLFHPTYRSQSMDDLSKISKDKWIGPRRTWSEMKRAHPTKPLDMGQLRKWSATQNMVQEESSTSLNVEDEIKITQSEGEINNIVEVQMSSPSVLGSEPPADEADGTAEVSIDMETSQVTMTQARADEDSADEIDKKHDQSAISADSLEVTIEANEPEIKPQVSADIETAIDALRKRESGDSDAFASYFGEQPSLLEQLGLQEISQNSIENHTDSSRSLSSKSSEENTIINDADSTITDSSEKPDIPITTSPDDRGKPIQDLKPGNIAYFVRIDEQYNASPAQRAFFDDDSNAPPLITTPIRQITSTSDSNISTNETKEDYFNKNNFDNNTFVVEKTTTTRTTTVEINGGDASQDSPKIVEKTVVTQKEVVKIVDQDDAKGTFTVSVQDSLA